MTIVLGSVFRNSSSYVDRFFSQARNFRMQILDEIPIELLLVEGDSLDDTWARLENWQKMNTMANTSIKLIKRDHGGPEYGRIDDPVRWSQLAYAGNGVMENLPSDVSALIYVESDLIWSARDVNHLIDCLYGVYQCEAVAPLCKWLRNGNFYDTWGYRANGVKFASAPPYHQGLIPGKLIELDSAGSMIVMRGEVAKQVRFSEKDCIVGLCRNIRELGYHLRLNTNVTIWHPS